MKTNTKNIKSKIKVHKGRPKLQIKLPLSQFTVGSLAKQNNCSTVTAAKIINNNIRNKTVTLIDKKITHSSKRGQPVRFYLLSSKVKKSSIKIANIVKKTTNIKKIENKAQTQHQAPEQ